MNWGLSAARAGSNERGAAPARTSRRQRCPRLPRKSGPEGACAREESKRGRPSFYSSAPSRESRHIACALRILIPRVSFFHGSVPSPCHRQERAAARSQGLTAVVIGVRTPGWRARGGEDQRRSPTQRKDSLYLMNRVLEIR